MSSRAEQLAARTAAGVRMKIADDLRRLCEDAGISQRALARAAEVPPGFVARILAGTARPSIETYARLSRALGADLACRVYPNTGPTIRDRHQVRILEALLGELHPRWRPFTEVIVRRPASGAIDAALHDARAGILVATELQSELRRVEQLVRWSTDKAESLPSWSGWTAIESPAVSRLLIVRRTRANTAAAAAAEGQLRVAFPAHPADVLESLRGTGAWPGPALVWARIDRAGVRFLAER